MIARSPTTLVAPEAPRVTAAAAEFSGFALEFEALYRDRARRLRTFREFCEDEIVLSTGPFEKRKFRAVRNPWTILIFNEYERRFYSRIAAVGPTQTGKTLLFFSYPIAFTVSELRERIAIGVPTQDTAIDKWRDDIEPVFLSSPRLRHLLPETGAGSRGGRGRLKAIEFTNGVVARFMSMKAGDSDRSGFTAPNAIMTEVDKGDTAGEASDEADPITQIEARTDAYNRPIISLECTASEKEGRIWTEYEAGTGSNIYLRCVHCEAWVFPDREHLVGWQDADSDLEAGELGHLICPACGEPWSEEDRIKANDPEVIRLVHRGQEVDRDGIVHGEPPKTTTLGFRWTSVHNLLKPISVAAEKEWRAARMPDEDNSEKGMCQFVWARPYEGDTEPLFDLKIDDILNLATNEPRGLIPADCLFTTLGMDVGKYACHWALLAFCESGRIHVPDYGVLDVPTREMGGLDIALATALDDFNEQLVTPGWPSAKGEDAPRIVPERWAIDAHWEKSTDIIYNFSQHVGWRRALPYMGFGLEGMKKYNRPETKGTKTLHIGDGYHISKVRRNNRTIVYRLDGNADQWKSWIHDRLSTAPGLPGSLTLHGVDNRIGHLSFAKHMLSEKGELVHDEAKGMVMKWKCISKKNHWLDATYMAAVIGHLCGFRVNPMEKTRTHTTPPARSAPASKQQHARPRRGPGGRPFVSMRRNR